MGIFPTDTAELRVYAFVNTDIFSTTLTVTDSAFSIGINIDLPKYIFFMNYIVCDLFLLTVGT